MMSQEDRLSHLVVGGQSREGWERWRLTWMDVAAELSMELVVHLQKQGKLGRRTARLV